MKRKIIIIVAIVVILLIILSIVWICFSKKSTKPEDLLKQYFLCVENKNYEEMYRMINLSNDISKEEFLNRNKNIYEAIDANNIQIEIESSNKTNNNSVEIKYNMKMDTIAGNISFSNIAVFSKDENRKYKLNWASNLIIPELNNDYKLRVSTIKARRGSMLDRNENRIAEQGAISNIGIVPGKLGENKEENIQKISKLLNISVEKIDSSLSNSWVKEDSFVPLKRVSKDSTELKEQLLQISGVMINSVTDRVYPYKEATSHITGYVQSITAEELEAKKSEGYTSNSDIGKAGLERQYEKRLRGTNGAEIYIEDNQGDKVKTIVKTEAKDGENVKLTIDINIQLKLYEQLKNDKGFFVVMNPKTGEILALVSTPSYNANRFILGMTDEEWNNIINDDLKPLYTRFLEKWCPGSTFKPITGAIGLTSGKLSEEDVFNYTGLAWQKDSSWGSHKITTLASYNGSKNLENAIVHSDNIYFAQAVLKIGNQAFTEGLDKLKFNQNIDFELDTSKSQYSNSETIQNEGTLADSGYGQGQILVNPIHVASIYSAFVNDGNMIKPYLEYKESKEIEYLVQNAFSKEAANTIKEDLIKVVENPSGTANDMKINGAQIAGKTGTAELKASKGETGETLGWFNCFTTDENSSNPLLIVSMVENASKNGGSHYLIKKIRTLFE